MPEFTAELEAEFSSVGDRTELQHQFHKSPLKIAKTFARKDNQLGVCIMDCSPGLMAGDRYRLDWLLFPDSHVYITNQSYTKIHPSSERPAYQRQIFRLGRNARLEYKPEPIMLYASASCLAETEIRLEAGSILLWTDIVCPGRVLRGEVFQFEQFDNRLKVYYEGQLIYYNRQNIEPVKSAGSFRQIGGWEGHTHQGTLYLFADRINRELLAPILEVLQKYPALLSGVSLTYKYGLVISALGKSAWELQQLLDEAWIVLKSLIIEL